MGNQQDLVRKKVVREMVISKCIEVTSWSLADTVSWKKGAFSETWKPGRGPYLGEFGVPEFCLGHIEQEYFELSKGICQMGAGALRSVNEWKLRAWVWMGKEKAWAQILIASNFDAG